MLLAACCGTCRVSDAVNSQACGFSGYRLSLPARGETSRDDHCNSGHCDQPIAHQPPPFGPEHCARDITSVLAPTWPGTWQCDVGRTPD
ncbi:Uncharacterised protein [Mycobacterium tuberculosis]|nr:Uncharacterised protein [Mycobacterium tuberculosis]